MNTEELIAVLAADLKPVRRLLPPVWRLIGSQRAGSCGYL